MQHYGLIGFPLGHSFSKRFFSDKFQTENIDAFYESYPIDNIQKLDELLILAKRIHKDTEPSIENNASEYLLNVLGDVTGDVLMQGFTGNR